MDDDGLRVDALAERLAAGLRAEVPLRRSPSTRTRPGGRCRSTAAATLVELCRRHGVLILEDVAYRELAFDGTSLPTLWSLAPDVVLQAGTFSKVFFPGVRLGWAVGPRRGRRRAGGGQADHRPVRGRARAADARGVRARRGTSSASCRPPGRCTRRTGGAVGARSRAHAARTCTGRSRPAASSPGSRCPASSTRSRCARPRPRPASPTSRAAVPRRRRGRDGCGSRSASSARPTSSRRRAAGRRRPRRARAAERELPRAISLDPGLRSAGVGCAGAHLRARGRLAASSTRARRRPRRAHAQEREGPKPSRRRRRRGRGRPRGW